MTTAETSPRHVVFLDVETNGVNVRVHDAWEFAWWNLTTGQRGGSQIYIRDLNAFMDSAQPDAFTVNKFRERFRFPMPEQTSAALTAMVSATWPEGCAEPIIVGSKPTFDMEFMGKVLRAYEIGEMVTDSPWHHHPVDLGSYALGVLGGDITRPPSARRVAEMVGIPAGDHSAEGDVTSGGRAFLLLREAARLANSGDKARSPAEWLHDQPMRDETIERELIDPVAARAAEMFGALPGCPSTTVPCGFTSCGFHG